MSFPWLSSAVPKSLTSTYADRSRAAWRRELTERAALLTRLGYTKRAIVGRLGRALDYEVEPFAKLAIRREVSGLVDAAQKRR